MDKNDAINKITKHLSDIESLKKQHHENNNLSKWRRDCSVAIGYIFGSDSEQKKEFDNIRYHSSIVWSDMPDYVFQESYISGLQIASTFLESILDEINEYWDSISQENNTNTEIHTTNIVENIINRFHQVARQIRDRHNNRTTIDISDEYDVQDLFHVLLKLFFDDIRAEEYTSSYAGSASRTDFLLKKEKILIEIKKSRQSLRAKEVGEQLIIDSAKYQSHSDCNQIICFVYDPEGFIANPRGIEADLSKTINGIPISVYIRLE